jgi:hypothetical protein
MSLILFANRDQKWKNTLAYYVIELITVVKMFYCTGPTMIQSPFITALALTILDKSTDKKSWSKRLEFERERERETKRHRKRVKEKRWRER